MFYAMLVVEYIFHNQQLVVEYISLYFIYNNIYGGFGMRGKPVESQVSGLGFRV